MVSQNSYHLDAITAETLARTTADGLQNTAISNNTDAITAEATTRAAITAETLARTTADVFKTQLFHDAITAETLARTNADGLKTQLFLIIRMQ
jgi:hypothetical protein